MGQVERYVPRTKTQRPKCTAPYGQRYFRYVCIDLSKLHKRPPVNRLYLCAILRLAIRVKLCYIVDTADEHGNNLKGVFTYD